MTNQISYNRGVYKRSHSSGMDVYMYIDTPGEYLDVHGHTISDVIAKECGYAIDQFAKAKVKNDRIAQALAAIEEELIDEGSVIKEVVSETGVFKVVSIGMGRHYIEDVDGNRITQSYMPLEEAEKLIKRMVTPAKPETKLPEQSPVAKPGQKLTFKSSKEKKE